jgi:hypothetical protein
MATLDSFNLLLLLLLIFGISNKILLIFNMQKVNLWKKIHVIYSFFFVRKVVAHIVTFVFYCVVIPATVLVPEVQIPKWGAVYIPSMITILNAVGTPRYNQIFSIQINNLSNGNNICLPLMMLTFTIIVGRFTCWYFGFSLRM